MGEGDGAADYAGKEVRGAIVLTDGLAMPAVAHAAYQAGAAGMICVNPEGLHEMIISPVWGTPTPETAPYLPQLVAVSVRRGGRRHAARRLAGARPGDGAAANRGRDRAGGRSRP